MTIALLVRSKKVLIISILILIAGVAGATYAYTSALSKTAPSTESENPKASKGSISETNLSKAVLRVDGMSCSGCIYTIKSSLGPIQAVRDVLVNLAAGEAEVYYDASRLKDVSKIADAVTASGYPARVIDILSADQIQKERDFAASQSLYDIASVGKWTISRTDFSTEFNHAKNRYAQIYGDRIFKAGKGQALMDNLKVQIISRLINEGIQMQEIRNTEFKVDPKTVKAEFAGFLNKKGVTSDQFKVDIEKNGYPFDYFMKKFEIRVLISTYLDDRVFDGASDSFEKQRRYQSWFNNAKLLAKVVYYDKDIERLVQTRASGGGCSSGGGSCSAGR